jgi:tricorn protease interacting factor F2/3
MQHVKPLNYKIHLIPDLVNFKFEGQIEITFEAPQPVGDLSLNILDLAIWRCMLKQAGTDQICPFRVDPLKEELHIHLPQEIQGKIRLKIDYEGHINDQMAGLYRSKYVHEGRTEYIAVTQFEESDARRAFPCLDHPARKAIYDISMDIDQAMQAISNGDVHTETPLADGKKRVVFEQTPLMSSYLVFFGVGHFEFTQDTRDGRVRVATLPGMKPFAQFGLQFGRRSLKYSEDYYQIAYPLSKLDLIAIPDFAFGAMENWGAITFRENLLLHYPGVTSKSGEERICEVIAHEIAHQWFGNLVTPSDWKYLWLNESFATYFGYGVVDHYYPDWRAWEQFLNGQTETALARDGLHETVAIEIPGGEHVVINASTAPIIYSKGGSILRQIQGYIGDENFQKGLQHYLKTHAYDCAASRQLWEAFEAVSDQPVTAMMKNWIEQPGFPIVEVQREGTTLILRQQRFSYLPNDFEQSWLIPVSVRVFLKNGESTLFNCLMDGPEKRIEVAAEPAAYKINDAQTGFYRTVYHDKDNLKALGQRILDGELAIEDRWGLQNDLYALTKAGRQPFAEYMNFLKYYANEQAYLPLTSIAGNLADAYLILADQQKKTIADAAGPWFESLLDRIGREPQSEENHTISILRDQLLWNAAKYGSQPSIEFAVSQFQNLLQGASIHPDIMKSVMLVGARQGNKKVFDWFDQRQRDSGVEHERMNILMALGHFREPAVIEQVLQYVLERVPPRNKFIPVVSMAGNPAAHALMWDWYTANLKHIEQFHPMLYERIVAAIIPACGLLQTEAVEAFFKQYLTQHDKAGEVIRLSLERLKIHLRMKKANA